jgi:hypothetical protein
MRALRMVLTVSLLAAAVAGPVIAAAGGVIDQYSTLPIALAITDVAVAAVAGWMVLRRSSWPALSPLLQLVGLWVVVSLMRHLDLGTVGLEVTGALWLGGACLPALILFGFPDGFGDAHRRRILVASAVTVLVAIAAAMLGGASGPGTTTANATVVAHIPPGARLALAVQSVLVVVLTAAAVIGLVRRRGRYRLGRRSTVDPVVVAGVAWVVALAGERVVHLLPIADIRQHAGDVGGPADGYRPWASFVGTNIVLTTLGALLAVVGYVVVVRPRLDRLRDGRLAIDDRSTDEAVRDLATWVGDPSLRIAYADGDGGWVDDRGRPVRVDEPGTARTVLERDGEPVALLRHEPALAASPSVVRFAAAIAAGTIEADAAAAIADSRVVAARTLASRLVTAEHSTRVKLLGELEVGPLQDLRDCIDLLASGSGLAEVTGRLKRATAETRRISHGLYPPELIEGGLRAAVGSRQGAPSRRLATAVEVTAYLLVRDDPDAVFVDRGTMLEMRLSSTPDVVALDRVRILDGTWSSPVVTIPVGGT